jgi:photosystem II stability/assembly factor-like uncharacterized protein
MKKITILFFFLLFQNTVFAQLDYKLKTTEDGANFFKIVKTTRSFFNNTQSKSTVKSTKQKKQFERWVYYWKDRVNKDGTFPTETLGYFNAGILDDNGKVIVSSNENKSAEIWQNIGPQENPIPNGYSNFPQLGRLNAFLRIKHPTDRAKDVLFVGAPSGGIWKSTNNGTTWSAKTDFLAGIGVTDIKTAPTTTFANYTTKPIYVSTGDYDGGNVRSIGVLKSIDGGETFLSTGLSHDISEGKSSSQLIVSDDNTVIVGENRFIKKTTNGGTTWANIYDAGFLNANFGRVAVSGSNIMFSGLYDIYFSSNSGLNWSVPFVSDSQDKHAVTFGSDGNFYAQSEAGQIKKFNTSAGTFSNVGNIGEGYDAQGGYNQALIFKDGLFVSGEFNGQTSTDNGNSWHRSLNGYYNPNGTGVDLNGTYVHSDHHAMGLLDGQYEFWSVNDGGLNFINYSNINDIKPTTEYKSNGVICSQLYNVAITPNLNSGNYIMALQDNDGYSREMHNGAMQWIAAAAGDGVCAVINYNDPSIRYLGSQNGGLSKTGSGFTGKHFGESWGEIEGAGFVWPLEIHTTDPTILYAGGSDLYKITDATASADIETGISNAENLNAGAGKIEKITTHGTGIAVVGVTETKDDEDNVTSVSYKARFSKNSGTTWASLTAIENLTINSVDFNQSNMNEVYISVSGYSDGNKVFKSTDSGATWTNISEGLPNIVMKEIVLKQNQNTEILFVATELGVYFKNEANNWSKLGQALPNVIVNDIDINYTEDKLVAATFGRGLWHINIANITLQTDALELIENQFKLSPNPVEKGSFNFTVDKKYANFKYKMYNVLGGVVLEGKDVSENGTINVSSLSNGMYVFKAYKKGISFPSVKVLVNNK